MLFSDWSALAFSLAALLQVYHALSYFFHLLRLSVSQSLNGAYHWSVLSRLCCRPKLQKCKSYFDFGSPNMSKLITYDVQLNMLDHGRHCTVDMAILEYCGTPWLFFYFFTTPLFCCFRQATGALAWPANLGDKQDHASTHANFYHEQTGKLEKG